MATYFTQKNVDSVVRALVKAYNALHDSVQSATGASGNGAFHYDITSYPTGDYTNPSSSAVVTSKSTSEDGYNACANELLAVLKVHFNDDYAHAVADTTNSLSAYADGYAESAATLYAVLNAMKTKYNAHLSQSGVHFNNDSTNTVTAEDATDSPTAETLILELQDEVLDHTESGPAVGKVRLM